mmetsp:Transcript_19751/g.2676  ORF Transcript_19751/g.2676 Transcript_19751/m.2676 type:complete len:98 (-) Transcript_19751:19-312(-)
MVVVVELKVFIFYYIKLHPNIIIIPSRHHSRKKFRLVNFNYFSEFNFTYFILYLHNFPKSLIIIIIFPLLLMHVLTFTLQFDNICAPCPIYTPVIIL